ncbi:hypothetical protein DFR58_10673 [Anaerobacterium chartisolvens]|uniref:Uncharacterized protein n=1 Tax=Anaerobacterium chartisolvens TaxID=1297424 RepID=A0A369B9A7_9FIRM|nr:hypothetical protein [Anaerobacterium chartisolvens]RCX17905.1 hypothetical protein DFR58_10673 [Anaerobacterium chartisolvens]
MRGQRIRGQSIRGQGFGGHANCQGYGAGNPLPYCRHNPLLPSRRAMAMAGMGNTTINGINETEYLKSTAVWLNSQLEAVNKRISDLNYRE